MTMSTLLRAEAVDRLMEIQEVCNRVFTADAKHSLVEDLAHEIIKIIKAP